MLKEFGKNQSIPVTDWLLGRYRFGRVASLSLDQGFTRATDRELLSPCVPEVVKPKCGKMNAAERERDSRRKFGALRQPHRTVESEINSREHGLNRCLDMRMCGNLRYVDWGVLRYNLHVIGRELLARQRARGDSLALACLKRPK